MPLKWEGTMMKFSQKRRLSGGQYVIAKFVLVLVVLNMISVVASLALLG